MKNDSQSNFEEIDLLIKQIKKTAIITLVIFVSIIISFFAILKYLH